MTIARTICLGFIGIIAIGTIMLIMPFSGTSGTWNDPLVALFTTTSAVCVTGLSVVDPGTYFSFWGQLIVALEAQIGGLGYMTMTTFLILLIGRKFDLKQRLAIQESFDRPFLQGSASLIRSIAATTLLFELGGVILMYNTFAKDYGAVKGLWLAIFHSVSAWNNAGFALFKDNLMSYHSSIPINLAITGLIIFGGIGYQVIIEIYMWLETLWKKRAAKFVFSLNFLVAIGTTVFLLLLGTIAFFLTEQQNPDTLAPFNLQDKILAAWFQSVTTRTAGFNTIDNGKLTAAGLFITMSLMFIGASPGGTGGGIKTTTFRILSNATRAVLEGKEEVIIHQRKISVSLLLKAVAVVFGSAATVVLAT
ncbi:MAG: potassium transporter TrkG, partial [Xenococcaceae cyanobacterium]